MATKIKNGIDVSHWQGNINWESAKNGNVEFAIIKAGGSDGSFYKDSMFEKNYREAKAAGIPVGAYYFVGSGCTNAEAGIADAKRFIELLKGKTFEYPVYIDLESTSPANKNGATQACISFCEIMEANGYYTGIYSSDISGFCERLDMSRLGNLDKWVARYGSKPKYVKQYGMWQYGSTGKVSGIKGNVDTNECYVNYPAIIKARGLNGFTKMEVPVTEPEEKKEPNKISVEELACAVIRGEWGVGQDRKDRLTKAGYDYSVIQNKVNEILEVKPTKTVDELAREVIRGEWGVGLDRKNRLTKAGYDYATVQKRVNELI